MTLLATTSILTRFGRGVSVVTGTACYESDLDREAGRPRYVLYLRPDLYEELGEPDTITITVEPGDRLNTDDEAGIIVGG